MNQQAWTCWRDTSHETGHSKFGWPVCSVCGAAPQFWERSKYVPDDLVLNVYVTDSKWLPKRTAIVGYPHEDPKFPWAQLSFESWEHGAAQYEHLSERAKWEAGLMHAADRMVTKYPTSKQCSLPEEELTLVGTYTPSLNKLDVINEDEIEAWLT